MAAVWAFVVPGDRSIGTGNAVLDAASKLMFNASLADYRHQWVAQPCEAYSLQPRRPTPNPTSSHLKATTLTFDRLDALPGRSFPKT